MELKPLMPTEVHVTTYNDVMHSVSENIQTATTITDVLHTTALVHESLRVEDVFKSESVSDLKMKLEFGDNDLLQSILLI